MKIKHILLLGIVGILGLGFSNASFSVSGVTYEDGYYRNESKGLITVIYGTGIFTMQDKNLGATEVYNGSNSVFGSYTSLSIGRDPGEMSVCSQIGNLYQWGNNYPFSCSGVVSLLYDGVGSVELTGNHDYNNMIYLDKPYLNSNNYDISDVWGGVSSISVNQQGPCDVGYHVPNNNDWNNISTILKGTFSPGIVENKNFQQFSYLTKFPFISPGHDLYRFTIRNNSSTNGTTYPIVFDSPYYNSTDFILSYNPDNWDYLSILPYGDWSRQLFVAPIRCFKNVPLLPNNTWVTLTGGDASLLPEPEPDEPNQVGYVVPDGSIFDINTYLIEQAVKCYMSSGTIGVCDGINYTGYIESLGESSVLWFPDEQRGYLEFYDAKPVLTQYCYNSDMIVYAFCSQLDIYEGVDLLYYYESGVLDFYMLGSGFGISAESLGSGQIGNITCQGAWCNGNVSTGGTQFIIPVSFTGSTGSSEIYSGNILSSGFFDEFFSDGFFFSCPFDYSGNTFTIGNSIIKLLGGRDPLFPINCIIAGYTNGSSVEFILPNNFLGSGTLLNIDNQDAKILYLFFDIIICIFIVIVFSKIFRLFTHK